MAAVATHHERYDGAGYPQGLAGDQIPFLGRVLALADAYSEVVAGDAQRHIPTTDEITEELTRQAGKRLDPHLVRAFVAGLQGEPGPPKPRPRTA